MDLIQGLVYFSAFLFALNIIIFVILISLKKDNNSLRNYMECTHRMLLDNTKSNYKYIVDLKSKVNKLYKTVEKV